MKRTSNFLFAIVILLAGSAHAQTDHLECFKVKDSMRKARYTTRLEGIAPPHGCTVRLPAKIMCLPTAQPELSPSPPGTAAGRNTGGFLCYKVRCRRRSVAPLAVTDRFGDHVVRPRRSRLLCAPLPASSDDIETCVTTTTTLVDTGSSTTTTTGSDESTTSTTLHSGGSTTTIVSGPTTTTTTTLPHCDTPNTSCGSCGDGSCQPIRPTGELICTFQNQAFCGGSCNSTADCASGRYCVGAAGDAKCCTPCF